MKLPHDPYKRNPRKQVVFHLHNVDQLQPFAEVESVFLTLCFLAKQLFVSTLFPLQKWALVSPILQKYYNIYYHFDNFDPSNNIIYLSQWWLMRNVKIELHCCYAVEKIINLPWFLWIFVYLICLYIPIVRTFTLFEQAQSVIELVLKLKSVRAFMEKSTAMSPQQSHASKVMPIWLNRFGRYRFLMAFAIYLNLAPYFITSASLQVWLNCSWFCFMH